MQEARKRVELVLEREQNMACRQTEGIRAHLEQRRAELVKTLAEINKLSANKSATDFLKVWKTLL